VVEKRGFSKREQAQAKVEKSSEDTPFTNSYPIYIFLSESKKEGG
jgi:hypothetical protein